MGIPVARILFHGSAAGVMVYGFKGLARLEMDRWVQTQYGGHLQFLTIQGYGGAMTYDMHTLILSPRLAIALVTMVLSLLVDLLPSVSGMCNTTSVQLLDVYHI